MMPGLMPDISTSSFCASNTSPSLSAAISSRISGSEVLRSSSSSVYGLPVLGLTCLAYSALYSARLRSTSASRLNDGSSSCSASSVSSTSTVERLPFDFSVLSIVP